MTTSVLHDKGTARLLLVPCNSRIYRSYVGFESFWTYSIIQVWGCVACCHWTLSSAKLSDMNVIRQLTLAQCLLLQRPRLTLRKVWLFRWQWRCQIAKKNWDWESQVYVIISLRTSHTKYRLLRAWLVQLVCVNVFQTPKERRTHLMKHTSRVADILSIKDGKISVYFTNLKCIWYITINKHISANMCLKLISDHSVYGAQYWSISYLEINIIGVIYVTYRLASAYRAFQLEICSYVFFQKCVGPSCKCYLNSGEECILVYLTDKPGWVRQPFCAGTEELQHVRPFLRQQSASWNSSSSCIVFLARLKCDIKCTAKEESDHYIFTVRKSESFL